jgi:UMP-CMP kinase
VCRYASVTVNLLLAAMKASGKDKFLIDGFPRNKVGLYKL